MDGYLLFVYLLRPAGRFGLVRLVYLLVVFMVCGLFIGYVG